MNKKKKLEIHKLPMIAVFSFVLVFLYVPIVLMIIFSFNDSRIVSSWRGFTLDYYVQLFQNRFIMTALRNTLIIGVLSALLSTTLGITAALALENLKYRGRKIFIGIIYLPLLMPEILLGVSLAIFFSSMQIEMGMITVLLAHITFCVSFTIILIQARMHMFDYSLEEAAMDLGANKYQIFMKIKLPLIFPGVLAAALLAFTLSIDDFIITFFTSGRGFNTLPVYVEGAIRRGTMTTINALSTLIICFTIVLTFLTRRVRKYML